MSRTEPALGAIFCWPSRISEPSGTRAVCTHMPLRTDEERVAHLLRRFGLGASEAEMGFYGKNGWRGAVDLLLDTERDEGFPFTLQNFALGNQNIVNLRSVQIAWMSRLVITRTPLREKLTLFWHDHFATSGQKVTAGPVMARHIEYLRQGGLGSFKDLVMTVSKDPAMVFWLDNQLNKLGKPNENFARELFELFTLGVGHYTEKDVQESARAFSGWGYKAGQRRTENEPRINSSFHFEESLHDDGDKTILGRTGPWTGEDVVEMACSHPQTAKHITKKLWEWFVYPSPSDEVVSKFAKIFKDSGLNIGVLLRAIMTSEEFYSERAELKLYKNPVEFTVATLRQLGIGSLMRDQIAAAEESDDAGRRRGLAPAAAANTICNSMGMELLFPPDVAGWTGGTAWISTATMVERIKWGAGLWRGSEATRGRIALRLDAAQYLPEGVSPQQFVQATLSLFDANLTQARVQTLETAVRDMCGERVPAGMINNAAATVTRLVFGAPEYQLQ